MDIVVVVVVAAAVVVIVGINTDGWPVGDSLGLVEGAWDEFGLFKGLAEGGELGLRVGD